MNSKGDLKIWWIPQIPGKSFFVPVGSPREGAKLLQVLANYDLFLLETENRPDFSNAGGLLEFDGKEWIDWEDAETGQDIDAWWDDVLCSESDRVNAR